MSTPERMHDQRHRAESFGAIADAYDRYRPSYPDALIGDILAAHPSAALDIGCGTGKAGRLIAARGVPVLGVEIDEDMAEVARRSGLEVEIGSFETWEPRGRMFDLAVSGQAWHWIDPALGVPKVVGVLRPAGLLALFWNTVKLDDGIRARLTPVYARYAPGVAAEGRQLDETGEIAYAQDLRAAGGFASVEVRRYPWDRTYTALEYVQLVQTYSDHVILPAEQRAALADAVVAAIEDAGGSVATRYVTVAVLAKAPQ
ncbi:MAG TPA: methyltransferase domain-containing protein [Jatrophihabitantaceae bacterium]|nr:methyltransferase domain-containing protein [Jatrophihabitantaceae bacterium]